MRLLQGITLIALLSLSSAVVAADNDLAEMERAAVAQYADHKYGEAVNTCRAALALAGENDFQTGLPFLFYCCLGDCYLEQESYDEALTAYRKAIEAAGLGPFDEYTLFDVYESIMCMGLVVDKPAQTIEYGGMLLELLSRYPAADHIYATVNANFLIAEAWMMKQSFAEAIIYYRRTLELLSAKRDKTRLINVPACMGLTYARLSVAENRNKFPRNSMQCLLNVLEIFDGYPELADAAKFPELNDAFMAALALVEEEKEGVLTDTARFYQSLAGYYAAGGNYSRFVQYHRKAVKIFIRFHNLPAAAASYARMADWWTDRHPERALKSIQSALELLQTFSGRNADAALTFDLAAKIYERNGDAVRAANLYQTAAMAISPDVSIDLAASIYFDAGRGLLRHKQYDPAIRYLRRALEYSRLLEKDSRSQVLRVIQAQTLLADAYRADGRLDEAIGVVRESMELRREYFGGGDDAAVLQLLGDLYVQRGALALAAETYALLAKELSVSTGPDASPRSLLECWLMLADIELKLEDVKAAGHYCDRALALLSTAPVSFVDDTFAMNTFRQLLRLYMQTGRRIKADECFALAMRRLNRDGVPFQGKLALLRSEYYLYSGKPGKSLVCRADAARRMETVDPAEAAVIWGDVARRLHGRNCFVAAADAAANVFRILKAYKVGQESLSQTFWADINGIMGDALRRNGAFKEADKYLRVAVEKSVAAYGDDSAAATAHVRLAENSLMLKDYRVAESEFAAALKCRHHVNYTVLNCYWGLARVNFESGNPDKAMSYGRKAEKLALKIPGQEKLLTHITLTLDTWRNMGKKP